MNTFQQKSSSTLDLLDRFQSKHACCGVNSKDDYNNLSSDLFPLSCCRISNCSRDIDINSHNGSLSLMHMNGCHSIIDKYLIIELWILAGVATLCTLLQILASTLMCTLYRQCKQIDDDPKFVINHLDISKSASDDIQGSSKTLEETVEITQI